MAGTRQYAVNGVRDSGGKLYLQGRRAHPVELAADDQRRNGDIHQARQTVRARPLSRQLPHEPVRPDCLSVRYPTPGVLVVIGRGTEVGGGEIAEQSGEMAIPDAVRQR